MATKKEADVKTKTTRKTSTKKTEETTIDNSVVEMLMKQIAELQAQIQQQDKKVEIKESIKKTDKKRRNTFNDIRDVEVEVQRVIGGVGDVKYVDKKTGDEYTWKEEGSIEYMTGDVLRRMNSTSQLFLKAPWLRILDNDEVIEVLGLKELYKNIDSIEDVDMLASMDEDELERLVKSLSLEYKNVLSTNVAYKISSEELNNINAIRKFERVLGKEFLN